VEKLLSELRREFDDGDDECVALLKSLWAVAHTCLDEAVPPFERYGWRWTAFGFQRDDPVSDVRGGGVLALKNLVSFLQSEPAYARVILASRRARREFDPEAPGFYPFAAAGINVTRLVSEFLLEDTHDKTFWPLLAKNEASFDQIYALAFRLVDRIFDKRHAKYMHFNDVLKEAKDTLRKALDKAGNRFLRKIRRTERQDRKKKNKSTTRKKDNDDDHQDDDLVVEDLSLSDDFDDDNDDQHRANGDDDDDAFDDDDDAIDDDDDSDDFDDANTTRGADADADAPPRKPPQGGRRLREEERSSQVVFSDGVDVDLVAEALRLAPSRWGRPDGVSTGGVLWKLPTTSLLGKWRRRYVVLHDDVIAWLKPASDATWGKAEANGYFASFARLRVDGAVKKRAESRAFTVEGCLSPNGKKVKLRARASDGADAELWRAAIQLARQPDRANRRAAPDGGGTVVVIGALPGGGSFVAKKKKKKKRDDDDDDNPDDAQSDATSDGLSDDDDRLRRADFQEVDDDNDAFDDTEEDDDEEDAERPAARRDDLTAAQKQQQQLSPEKKKGQQPGKKDKRNNNGGRPRHQISFGAARRVVAFAGRLRRRSKRNAAQPQEKSLPRSNSWVSCTDKEQRLYYVHLPTGKTQWDLPPGWQDSSSGWAAKLDDTTNCTYYYFPPTGETTWTLPSSLPEPQCGAQAQAAAELS